MDLTAAYALGRGLLDEHGLTAWTLTFDRARRRAGLCRHRDRVISLSGPLTRLHDEPDVRDTVLHEIAHALCDPRAGHGPRWQEMARRIGATPERCLAEDVPRIPGRWMGVCPQGHVIDRHRRPTRVVSCRQCRPGFDPSALFEWTCDGEVAPMHPSYLAELAALRSGGRTTPAAPSPAAVGVGTEVVLGGGGRWGGRVGRVERRARTRYHVRIGQALVTVPFALATPVSRDGAGEVDGTSAEHDDVRAG